VQVVEEVVALLDVRRPLLLHLFPPVPDLFS
jgi:hypothetical protein